ncbi:MAG: ABC transporter permease [Spirochaetales bacterium]|nr:ABC transporter permease [Spirochaetales bacterium]
MKHYALKRAGMALLAWAVSVLAISSILNSTLEATARADILESVRAMVGASTEASRDGRSVEEFRADTLQALERAYGLHLPLPARVLKSWWRIVTLDLGEAEIGPDRGSTRRRSVLKAAASTAALFTLSTALSVAAGLSLALAASERPGGRLDRLLARVAAMIHGAPTWWAGAFLVMAFSIELRIFPFGALATVPPPENPFLALLDRLSYLILPVLSIASLRVWAFALLARAALDSNLHEDFVMSARGRGIPEGKIMRGHVLRSSGPAIASNAVIALVQSFGGDALVEIVFARPGLGLLLWTSIRGNDIRLTAGAFAALALVICVSMALLDLAYGLLDPRVRSSK